MDNCFKRTYLDMYRSIGETLLPYIKCKRTPKQLKEIANKEVKEYIRNNHPWTNPDYDVILTPYCIIVNVRFEKEEPKFGFQIAFNY